MLRRTCGFYSGRRGPFAIGRLYLWNTPRWRKDNETDSKSRPNEVHIVAATTSFGPSKKYGAQVTTRTMLASVRTLPIARLAGPTMDPANQSRAGRRFISTVFSSRAIPRCEGRQLQNGELPAGDNTRETRERILRSAAWRPTTNLWLTDKTITAFDDYRSNRQLWKSNYDGIGRHERKLRSLSWAASARSVVLLATSSCVGSECTCWSCSHSVLVGYCSIDVRSFALDARRIDYYWCE